MVIRASRALSSRNEWSGLGGGQVSSPIAAPVRVSSAITAGSSEADIADFDWESAKQRAATAWLTTASAAKANADGVRATSNDLALTDSLTSQQVFDLPAAPTNVILPQSTTDIIQRAPTILDGSVQIAPPAIVTQASPTRVTSPSTSALISRNGIYQPLGAERLDHRCGPNYNGAACGASNCCSTDGWCGAGPQCAVGTNDVAYNGPNAIVTGKKACALNCNEAAATKSARYLFMQNSGGRYVMMPVNIVNSGLQTCDIKYEYRPASDPTGLAIGTDKRRFGFKDAGTCNWQAVAMGPSGSATYV